MYTCKNAVHTPRQARGTEKNMSDRYQIFMIAVAL